MKSQASEFLYRLFFDNTLDGLAYCQMIFDAQERPVDFLHVEVNKNFETLTGLKEAIGKKVTELIPGIRISNPELFEICGRVSLTGKPENFETYIEGLARWFFVSAYSPQKNFFVAVFQNITDRKQIEKNLENAKTAARNVLEDLSIEKSKVEIARAKEEAILLSVGDGLLATDEKGNITLINKMAEKLLGKKSEEVMGKFFSEVIALEDEKGVSIPLEKRPMRMALTTTTTTTTTTEGATYYCVRKDETRFPIAITATSVILDGKLIGAIEVFRDITRENEVDRAKSEFVSLASHQLRTPLATVNWYTEMLLAGDAGKVTSDQKKYLEKIYTGNKRMVELVNAFLNVSRIELGTFTIEPKLTDVIELVQSVVDEQKFQIDEKKITLSTVFEKNIPLIQVDQKLLRMVVQNLLSNAGQYTPEGGRIEVSLGLDDKRNVLLKISDTGYGIPKNQQDKIFTKLFRADNVREKDTEGTGLGLYIVKSIMEHSGGRVWFESAQDKGTTFFASLPLEGMQKKEGME